MKRKHYYCFIILLLAIIAIFVACGKQDSEGNGIENEDPGAVVVDIFESPSIESYGINNYGYLEVDVYENSVTSINIASYVKGVFGSPLNIPGNLHRADGYGDWYDLFEIEIVGENQNLSNGDQVVLRAKLLSSLEEEGETMESLTDALGIRLLRTEMTYTVSDLKEGTVINVFDLLEEYMSFTGANGSGYLVYDVEYGDIYEIGGYYLKSISNYDYSNRSFYIFDLIRNNKTISRITLTAFGSGALEEGSTVNLEIEEKAYLLESEKEYYLVTETQYPVPDLGESITSGEDLKENDINEIISYAESVISEYYSEDEYSVEGVYFATVKPHVVIENEHQKVAVFVIYKCMNFWGMDTAHMIICSSDFYRNTDGSLHFPEDPSTGHYHSSEDPDDLSELDEDYSYKKLY